MLLQTGSVGLISTSCIHDVQCGQTPRVPSSLRPVLRVATEQQFHQISPIARVLIHQAELAQSITFQNRPQARSAALDVCRALASVIIARGC